MRKLHLKVLFIAIAVVIVSASQISSDCKDTTNKCSTLTRFRRKQCRNKVIRVLCPSTCRSCNRECKDIASLQICSIVKRYNRCNTIAGKYSCQKTCKYCGTTSITTTKAPKTRRPRKRNQKNRRKNRRNQRKRNRRQRRKNRRNQRRRKTVKPKIKTTPIPRTSTTTTPNSSITTSEATSPNSEAPETTTPLSESSETTPLPVTKAPETTVPETTEANNTALPITKTPRTAAPETTVSKTTALPVTEVPETLAPETTTPLATKVPETTASPATKAPETTTPETITSPVTAAPETTAPKSTKTTFLETTAPNTTPLETTIPKTVETTTPETTTSKTTSLETTAPQTTSPVTAVPETTKTSPSQRTTQNIDNDFIVECLKTHNGYRSLHVNTPDMEWDQELQKSAQEWANRLINTNQFSHSELPVGENLYYASNSFGVFAEPCKDATKAWYDEIKDYDFKNPGFSQVTGHFTQVIWKSSTKLGAAFARSGNQIIVVAHYAPAGNVIGQFRENVRPVKMP